ncbi:hypothetical protein E2C01_024996 [Portunus trituberculatus]|uniref:Uncharacterized protein n=1 Tax=Portunus trituberculatus TaxID=210409 RepID=A0A5B7EBW6_PORTR|nr:hypothetical protein [Portunus trituberculatus]
MEVYSKDGDGGGQVEKSPVARNPQYHTTPPPFSHQPRRPCTVAATSSVAGKAEDTASTTSWGVVPLCPVTKASWAVRTDPMAGRWETCSAESQGREAERLTKEVEVEEEEAEEEEEEEKEEKEEIRVSLAQSISFDSPSPNSPPNPSRRSVPRSLPVKRPPSSSPQKFSILSVANLKEALKDDLEKRRDKNGVMADTQDSISLQKQRQEQKWSKCSCFLFSVELFVRVLKGLHTRTSLQHFLSLFSFLMFFSFSSLFAG